MKIEIERVRRDVIRSLQFFDIQINLLLLIIINHKTKKTWWLK